MSWRISRRTVLRGLGASVALPLLDAMAPLRSANAQQADLPRRLLFFFVPNGLYMPSWTPDDVGENWKPTATLQPLAPVKDRVLLLSGLDNRTGDIAQPGHHARGTASFLTCVPPAKNPDGTLQVGISVDQLAAQRVGNRTRFASLELGVEDGTIAGACDSGYSCAYTNNIAWSGPASPVAKEVQPHLVFDRLFAGTQPGETQAQIEARNRYKKSILDFVSDDAKSLQSKLGSSDRKKLDEYLAGIRSLEQRLSGSALTCNPGDPPAETEDRQERVQLMCDLMALAFQCDLTRIATFMIGNGQTNYAYHFLGVGEGHHELSHHRGNAAYIEHLKKIDRWEVEQFAWLVQRLSSIPEGEGTVLDNSMVLFGSELSDGNRHHHINLPLILAGRGGGTVRTGRHLFLQGAGGEFPIADLFLTMLDWVGVEEETFGTGLDGKPYGTKRVELG